MITLNNTQFNIKPNNLKFSKRGVKPGLLKKGIGNSVLGNMRKKKTFLSLQKSASKHLLLGLLKFNLVVFRWIALKGFEIC